MHSTGSRGRALTVTSEIQLLSCWFSRVARKELALRQRRRSSAGANGRIGVQSTHAAPRQAPVAGRSAILLRLRSRVSQAVCHPAVLVCLRSLFLLVFIFSTLLSLGAASRFFIAVVCSCCWYFTCSSAGFHTGKYGNKQRLNTVVCATTDFAVFLETRVFTTSGRKTVMAAMKRLPRKEVQANSIRCAKATCLNHSTDQW